MLFASYSGKWLVGLSFTMGGTSVYIDLVDYLLLVIQYTFKVMKV